MTNYVINGSILVFLWIFSSNISLIIVGQHGVLSYILFYLVTTAPGIACATSGSQSALVESLTQAFTKSKVTSPAIEGKIAELIDNMLIGGLRVKERVEKHPPPENCNFLAVTMVMKKSETCCPEKAELWIWLSSGCRSPCCKEYRP